jgi:hypothetical protein
VTHHFDVNEDERQRAVSTLPIGVDTRALPAGRSNRPPAASDVSRDQAETRAETRLGRPARRVARGLPRPKHANRKASVPRARGNAHSGTGGLGPCEGPTVTDNHFLPLLSDFGPLTCPLFRTGREVKQWVSNFHANSGISRAWGEVIGVEPSGSTGEGWVRILAAVSARQPGAPRLKSSACRSARLVS